jgi:hypothetical protein
MLPGNSRRRTVTSLTGAGVACVVTLACSAAAVPAAAGAARQSGDGDLSSRLTELAKPAIRSAPPGRQARELSLARQGPGSLLRLGNRVLVEVRFERGAVAGVDDLRRAGMRILDVNPRYQRVTVAARPAALRQLARIPLVAGAAEVLAPLSAAVSPCFGDATSEGDVQLRADEAREAFGVDGSGVTVGILSDSFGQNASAPTGVAGDIASGDLPGAGSPCKREDPVGVLDDTETKGEDEGRAMAQIVHDLAPGAKLAFATAFKKTMFGFADNIRKLAEPVGSGGGEADVIVDDVLYFEEPFFQEGPVGVAVREVTEAGVNYFSAAGNNNLRNSTLGLDFSSWEAPEFRDASPALCPSGPPGEGLPGYVQHCMDFDPGAGVDTDFGITVADDETLKLDLQWKQPWEGVTTDLDAYLLDSAGVVVAESENFNVTSTQVPYEFFSWTNPLGTPQAVRLVIDRCSTTCDLENGGDTGSPRLKFALLQNGGGVTATEYEESGEGDVVGPTIFGHNGAKDAMSVGAIRYSTNKEPERFSSRGPVTNYFGPVTGAGAAAELPSPETLAKPDLVATDGGANTFFGSCFLGAWRFFGTSAAAPHAAAVAALQLDAQPGASVEEVSDAQRDGVVAVEDFPPGPAVGAGRLDAVKAIEALGLTPASSAPQSPPPPVSCLPGEEEEPEPEPEPEPKEESPVVQPPSPTGSGSNPPAPRRAPNTFFGRRPKAVLRTQGGSAVAVFRFASDEAGAAFLCKIDQRRFRACPQRLSRRFALGPHVLRVKARDQDGDTDPTPAVFRFRVTQIPPG